MSYSGPVMDGEPPRQRPAGGVWRGGMQMAKAGVSFGSALAIVISWSVHHSIIWAIVQGFFSWLYVAYYAITR
ncbi:MAG TPA: hypothetical protein VGM82_21115 [Gemmatimonadaceae bacterium]